MVTPQPSLKISCKSVQPFSRNVANKEINKQREKSPENNTPSPYRWRGNDGIRNMGYETDQIDTLSARRGDGSVKTVN